MEAYEAAAIGMEPPPLVDSRTSAAKPVVAVLGWLNRK